MITKFNGILALFFAFIVQISFAQEKTISGIVSDQSGPLPGVSVQKKGSASGTETDFDGKYTIKAKSGDVLIFRFVGMKTVEKTVGNSNTIDVVMGEDSNVLEEVVVTGVATGTSRKKLGVSVNSISLKKLESPGTQSIDQALQGKIAGTIIQSTTGQPGQQQNIILRAINSLNSSQPMILIDGVQILDSSSSIGGASNQSSRLADIDFSTVERVETISGAAAGTIYGAQGANGVINIITKRGKAGKMKVTVRTDVGVVDAIAGDGLRRSSLHRYQTDAQGFLTDLNGVRVTDLNNESQYGAVAINTRTVGTSQLGDAGINDTPYAEQTFDATDVLFNTAVNQTLGVNLVGGSEKTSYLLAANRTQQESILVPGEYVKYDARFNLGIDLAENLKVSGRFDVINSSNDTGTNTDNANANNLINNVFQNLPHVDLLNTRNSDNDFVIQPDLTDPNSTNPFFFRRYQTRLDEITRYISNFNLNYSPTDYLTFDVKYGYDTYTQNFTFFQENKSDHQQERVLTNNKTGRINFITNQEYFQNFLASATLSLDFKEQFGWDTNIVSTTTINFDWRDRNLVSNSVSGTDNPFGAFGSYNISQSSTKVFNGYSESPFRTYGYLVNQKFDFGSLFGFSAGFRQDFSNRFGSGLDFTFPRADAYFNIADTFESDSVNLLKLRAAYGEAGIQPPFGDNIITLQGTTLGADVGLSFPATLQNESLEVERTSELEVGLDYGFTPSEGAWFSNVSGFINYFTRENNGAIFGGETATSTGSGLITSNNYDLSSNGFELSADTQVYTSEDFGWNFGVRFTKSTATLDRIASGQPLVVNNNFVLEEGQEVGTFSLFKVVTDINETDLEGNPIIAAADQGDYTQASSGYIVNKNTGNVVITPDKRTLGSSQPDFVMTFINDFQISDFVNVSMQLDWFQGLDAYNNAKQWLYNNGLHADTSVPVTIEDPSGTPQTGAFVQYYTSLYNTNVPLSHFLEDASFLRLRSVAVNFKLKKFIKTDFIDALDVRISGRNLLTITDYTGLDPEASRTFGNTFQRGFDEFTMPNTKSINLGVTVSF
ncbi:MAG: SusC/RagA family TonB-linked outer membrane protein [Tenacibaculum sp.]|nr:SusC/RagA family TonB-linked outer membrane protein [Tenacibaculum sp.]